MLRFQRAILLFLRHPCRHREQQAGKRGGCGQMQITNFSALVRWRCYASKTLSSLAVRQAPAITMETGVSIDNDVLVFVRWRVRSLDPFIHTTGTEMYERVSFCFFAIVIVTIFRFDDSKVRLYLFSLDEYTRTHRNDVATIKISFLTARCTIPIIFS